MPYPSTLPPAVLALRFQRATRAFLSAARRARLVQPRGIHAARVASRRLRELLAALADDDRRQVRTLRRDIRRVARAMGRVRELDVALDLVAQNPLVRAWPRGVVGRVQQDLAVERVRRQEVLMDKVAPASMTALSRALRAIGRQLAGTHGPRLHAAHAATNLEAALAARRRLRAATLGETLARAGTVYDPSALHGVRVVVKKLRYVLEWARAGASTPVAQAIADLRSAQGILGDLNDLHTLQAYVRRFAARPRTDRATVRALQAGIVRLEAEARVRHARLLRLTPRLEALAVDLARQVPLEWIRRRPVRMGRLADRERRASPRAATS
jgi:CHAD domain-containing protein